jgi:hypothetical protein
VSIAVQPLAANRPKMYFPSLVAVPLGKLEKGGKVRAL